MTKEPRYPSFPDWPQSSAADAGLLAVQLHPQPRPALPCPEQLEWEIQGDFRIRSWIFCVPELPAPPWKLGRQRSHPSWSWSPGAVCQAGAGLRSEIVLESSEQNQTQSPRTERWRPKLSLLEKQSWKKKPSSPCLACSTACLGFMSLGSQRSLLQSPECVWLLNSAAQKGDAGLFASPGQIFLLCDSFVASATRSTWCLLAFVRQVPESCASAPTSCSFHLHPGERREVSGARLMLQDVPVRYPRWRLVLLGAELPWAWGS